MNILFLFFLTHVVAVLVFLVHSYITREAMLQRGGNHDSSVDTDWQWYSANSSHVCEQDSAIIVTTDENC